MRIAVVDFLNAAPLWWGLARSGPAGWRLLFRTPAECAAALARGEADLALVPTRSLWEHGFHKVGNLGVAARGPVESVVLQCRTEPAEVRTCLLDPASRTSAGVLPWLLRRAGARNVRYLAPGEAEGVPDARLVIGDPALRPPPPETRFSLDLSDWWKKETGLPLVFALWAAEENPGGDVPEILGASLEYGERERPRLARRWAAALGLSPRRLLRYLRQRIHHRLAAPEEECLRRLDVLWGEEGSP